jgi:hypothetical protein
MRRTFALLLATSLLAGPGLARADDKAKEKIEAKKKADAEAKKKAEGEAKRKAEAEAKKKTDERPKALDHRDDGQQKAVTQTPGAKPAAPAATAAPAKPGAPPAAAAPVPAAAPGQNAPAKPGTPAAATAAAPAPPTAQTAAAKPQAPAEPAPAKPAAPASDTAQSTTPATATKSAPQAQGAAQPQTPSVLQLAGRWSSNAGTVYDITQSGDTFRWTVVKGRGHDQQIGAGTIKGVAVEASWTAPFAGASSGAITADGGRAIRIQWRNGAVFVRDFAGDKGPAAAPADPSTSQLAGRWRSNAGTVYDITQSGATFRWTVVQGRGANQQIGAGTIKGAAVEASWTAPFAGATNGTVTATDGRAIRIQWRNGTVFIRDLAGEKGAAAAPADPSVPQLAGRWSSNAGTVYDITQSGETFTWVVVQGRGQNQQIGAGTIKDTTIEASWSAPFAGATSGTITTDNGKAMRIQWKNGTVFIR